MSASTQNAQDDNQDDNGFEILWNKKTYIVLFELHKSL